MRNDQVGRDLRRVNKGVRGGRVRYLTDSKSFCFDEMLQSWCNMRMASHRTRDFFFLCPSGKRLSNDIQVQDWAHM